LQTDIIRRLKTLFISLDGVELRIKNENEFIIGRKSQQNGWGKAVVQRPVVWNCRR
jgi:hypothetical protein